MENLVRVPFDVELAKKIQAGEIEGKIVTRDGRNVRVVCWDRKDVDYPIIALIDNAEKGEGFGFFTTDGVTPYYDNTLDIMLEIPEYMALNDGDVVFGGNSTFIYNGRIHKVYGYFGAYCGLFSNGDLIINEESNDTWCNCIKRKATEEEVQKLIDALKASKDPIAKEYLKRFFNIDTEEPQEAEQKQKEDKPQHEFKPFDKVLVRDSDDKSWIPGFFWCKGDSYRVIGGTFWNHCIHYEGNEHLLGTSDNE